MATTMSMQGDSMTTTFTLPDKSPILQHVWELVGLGRVLAPISDLVVRVVKWKLEEEEEKDVQRQCLSLNLDDFVLAICRQFGLERLSKDDRYGLEEFFDLWKDVEFRKTIALEPIEAQVEMVLGRIHLDMRLKQPTAIPFERACIEAERNMKHALMQRQPPWLKTQTYIGRSVADPQGLPLYSEMQNRIKEQGYFLQKWGKW